MPLVSRAEDLIGEPVPDLALPASTGETFRFRVFAGRQPLVLFFYIHNATPG